MTKVTRLLIIGAVLLSAAVTAVRPDAWRTAAVSADVTTQESSDASNASPFPDISNSYAQKAIIGLYQRGIVKGDERGLFHPEQPVTRAEWTALLGRTLGITPVMSAIPAYADVPKAHWAYGWIQACTSLGVTSGTGPATFAPRRPLSRQEAAVLVMKALRATPPATPPPFGDSARIAPWAAPYVSQAAAHGLINGYQGTFRPLDPITRQEAAVVLDRMLGQIAPTAAAGPAVHLGWAYRSSTAQYETRVTSGTTVNTLSPRWFFLNQAGRLDDCADASLVTWARQRNLPVWPLIGNRFDPSATHAVLADDEKRQALADEIAGLARRYQLDGVNVDFEAILPEDRERFTRFIGELAAALHAGHALLSVDVPPDTGTSWSQPYDYAALGKSADYLVLMAYEEHWMGSSRPGSVSSLPWFRQSVEKLTALVPAAKVIVGVPLYTRVWREGPSGLSSRDLTLPEAGELIRQSGKPAVWQAGLGQYVASYTAGGAQNRIWMEDSRSLSLKVQTALRLGAGGIAYWYIGSESPDVWAAVRNAEAFELRPALR